MLIPGGLDVTKRERKRKRKDEENKTKENDEEIVFPVFYSSFVVLFFFL